MVEEDNTKAVDSDDETVYIAWWSQSDAYELHSNILRDIQHTFYPTEQGHFVTFPDKESAETARERGLIVTEKVPSDPEYPPTAYACYDE